MYSAVEYRYSALYLSVLQIRYDDGSQIVKLITSAKYRASGTGKRRTRTSCNELVYR